LVAYQLSRARPFPSRKKVNPIVLRRWIKVANKVGAGQFEARNPMTIDVQGAFVPVPMAGVHASKPVDTHTGLCVSRSSATARPYR
jgi:hypothetical protein